MPQSFDLQRCEMSRRHFLASLAILVTGGFLAACRVYEEELGVQRPTAQALVSPEPELETISATPENNPDLAAFLTFSAVLTGYDDLSPALGQVYLEHLNNHPKLALTPLALIEQLNFDLFRPPSLETLESTGLFDEEGKRQVADKIIEYWYTGVYDVSEKEQAVATTVDSLAWKAMTFAPPLTICGPQPGFWAENPHIAPVPPVTADLTPDNKSGG